jgi:hypothetical protein
MGKYEYNIVPRTLLSETKVVKEEVEEFVCHSALALSAPVPKIYALQGKWDHIVQNGDGRVYLRVFYYSKTITSKNGLEFMYEKFYSDDTFTTYEQALEQGLERGLKLIR